MKIYAISVMDGKETIARDLVRLPNEVKSYLNDITYHGKFIIVDSYTYKDNRRRDSMNKISLIRSIMFLNEEEVYRSNYHLTYEDIEYVKNNVTIVYKLDGSVEYMAPVPLSTPEVQAITGSEIFTMKIVKDEPQRMAVLSVDNKQFGLKEKPQLNKVASEKFHCNLYGNVIYINENLVS